MQSSDKLTVPLPRSKGEVEITETSGRCDDCGIRGGGLLLVHATTPYFEGVEKVGRATLCGECFALTVLGQDWDV